uniref:Uncharacterized protein n=1 Tax=Solanum tuberosum TaxID=4113 RepID=M1DP38_SOLTU
MVDQVQELSADCSSRVVSRTMVPFTGKFTICQLKDQSKGAIGNCKKKVHGRVHDRFTDRDAFHGQLHGSSSASGTMPPRRKKATNNSDVSNSENTLPQSKEGGSHFGSISTSGSKSNDGSSSQSIDNSGGSAESEKSSQENTNTSPPATNTEAETGVREEAATVDEDAEITNDDTMVISEEFFNKGIVSKLGEFRKRPPMPETRVVMADIQAFSEIYRLFQIHKF